MTWHVVRKWKTSRFWAVLRVTATAETLVVVCVYRKGAVELAAALNEGAHHEHAAA